MMHQCNKETLVRNPRPIENPEDDGETVAFILRCCICGRELHEVYTRQEGLWDPVKREYVKLGENEK
jgi:hypothetical protein